MRTAAILATAAVLGTALAAPAAAADKVPVKLKVKGCDGCSVMATWYKTGTASGASKAKSKTKQVSGSKATLTFNIPKGYYMYFTAVSGDPNVQPDAATVMVTQFVGKGEGDSVTATQARDLNDGAYYCLKAKKQTIKTQAAVVTTGAGFSLLGFWANPQLAAKGNTIKDGIDGVYGTQNTLICKGSYY